jgi:pimeloyl-ACP methyl ester carboxylesterase
MSSPAAFDPPDVFVDHEFAEQRVDLGEIRMNYATAGDPDRPALLLVPAQTESWWGYEAAMTRLADSFAVYAVDLRGQGRSSRTPGRYTLDNMGNDLVRFIDLVIGGATIVSGNSSGGVLAAWLAAYAKPGQIRGALCEDPPLFASEVTPACGQSIRQSIGQMFGVFSRWLGDGWSVGDWAGMQTAIPRELEPHILGGLAQMRLGGPPSPEPPQNLREYDPEWARSFWSGAAGAGCDHLTMLASAKTPILLTHHVRSIDPATNDLLGAVSDTQVQRARDLVTGAGQAFEIVDLPEMPHSMHVHDPHRFTEILVEWAQTLR